MTTSRTATPTPRRSSRQRHARTIGCATAAVVLLAACSGADAATTDAADEPATTQAAADTASADDSTAGADRPEPRPDLVTDKEPRPVEPLDRPAVGESYVDPAFGTSITRITDAGAGGVVKPMYSTMPAWNADESLMVLYATENRSGTHLLLDGETYEEVRELDLDPADIEQLWWHPRDPDLILYPSGNELRSYSVSADASTTVKTFEQCSSVTAAGDAQYVSWDGDVVGLLCTDPDAGPPSLLTHRISTDDTGEPFALESELWVAPVPVPWGGAFWFGTDTGPRLVDADGKTLRRLRTIESFEHSTIGRSDEGRATHYSVVFDPVGGTDVGSVVATDVYRDTSEVIVGRETGYPYPPSGTHLSAVAHRTRGLVAVSIVGVTDPAEQDTLDQELLLVDQNVDAVYRVGHHRSHGKQGGFGYFAEPHVTISPTGTRLLFGSDWGDGDRVDTYVVDLR